MPMQGAILQPDKGGRCYAQAPWVNDLHPAFGTPFPPERERGRSKEAAP